MRLPNTIALAVLLSAAPAFAQEDPTKPAPQVKKFAPLIGTWEASGTFAEGPGGERKKWTEVATAKWVLGGHFVQEDVEINLGAQYGTLAFRNFYGWDNENQRYIRLEVSNYGSAQVNEVHWVDDNTMVYASQGMEMGQFSVERWTTKFDGDTITMRSEAAFGAGEFYNHVEGTSKRTSAKARDAKAINAAFMPDMNNAPAKVKMLASMAGTYRMEGWMVPPGMPKVNISATEQMGWILGNTVMEVRLKGDPVPEMGNMEYLAWGCWAWDDNANCLKSFWLSNMGEVGADEMRRVGDKFIITVAGPYQGQPRVMRGIMEIDESGAISQYDAHTVQGDEDPVHSFHAKYKRQN